MTLAASAQEIFDDAHHLYGQALTMFESGAIRDAAEKAWCSTKRATDALILARTGREPESSRETSQELRNLIHADRSAESLRGRYYSRQMHLHGDCFYSNRCEPLEDTLRVIRDTEEYIRDAERLAGL